MGQDVVELRQPRRQVNGAVVPPQPLFECARDDAQRAAFGFEPGAATHGPYQRGLAGGRVDAGGAFGWRRFLDLQLAFEGLHRACQPGRLLRHGLQALGLEPLRQARHVLGRGGGHVGGQPEVEPVDLVAALAGRGRAHQRHPLAPAR